MTNTPMYSLEYGPNSTLPRVQTVNTGGGLQPLSLNVSTGGGLPPSSLNVRTGGTDNPYAAPSLNVHTGGPLPPQQVPFGGVTTPPTGAPGLNLNSGTGVPGTPNSQNVAQLISQMWQQLGGGNYNPGNPTNPATLANDFMGTILNGNSPYIQDARLQALEQANSRGILNGSIAAGAGQRAAIESAMPMFQQAYGLQGQREAQNFQAGQNQLDRALQQLGYGTQLYGQQQQQQFQGGQNALDRVLQKYGVDTQSYNEAQQRELQRYGINTDLLNNRENRQFQGQQSALDRTLREKLQSDAVFQQDWLNSKDFSRQFNAALAMIPINSANQLTQMIAQYGAENPEVYTPQVMSGMVNFLTKNMAAIIDQYFKVGGGT